MSLVLPLIFFCFFVFLSISRLLKYFKTNDKTFIKKAVTPWIYSLVLICVLSLLSLFTKPVSVDRKTIIGNYVIDNRFYPGKNADWQKEHFRFQVTEDDQFIFYEKLADKSEREYYGSVKWANENQEKWSIHMDKTHHVVDPHPVLYRSNKGFYYVFRSKLFGNMFFNKVEKSS